MAVDVVELWAAPYDDEGVLATIWLYAYLYAPYAAWVVFFVTLLFLMWLTYRLARNLNVLAPGKFSLSPTYAIGTFLVPIANIVMPPRVTGLIARDTFAIAGEDRSHNAAIGWWWGTFLLTALLSNVATIAAANSGAFDPAAPFDRSQYQTSLAVNLFAGLVGVVSCVSALRVFGPIARTQAGLVVAWRDARAQGT